MPFITDGKLKILSFRSRDRLFKADPGVVPDTDVCEEFGITVVQTKFQHADISDRGPDHVKTTILAMLDKFFEAKTHTRPSECLFRK